MCTNRGVQVILDVLVYVFVGLSACVVLFTAAATAPEYRETTTWLAFAVGGGIAVALGTAARAYGEAATALIAGVIAAIAITRYLRRSSSPALANSA